MENEKKKLEADMAAALEEKAKDKSSLNSETVVEESEDASDEKSEDESGEENKEFDYKAELERVQKSLAKAQNALTKERLSKKREKDEEIDENPSEPSTEVLEERIRNIIREETSAIRRDLVKGELDREVNRVARNADEAELIKYVYSNLIIPTGNLREDVENAKLLANRKRLNQEYAEIEYSKRSNELAGKSGSGAGTKTNNKAPIRLTDIEKRLTKAPYNLTPEEIIKARTK